MSLLVGEQIKEGLNLVEWSTGQRSRDWRYWTKHYSKRRFRQLGKRLLEDAPTKMYFCGWNL